MDRSFSLSLAFETKRTERRGKNYKNKNNNNKNKTNDYDDDGRPLISVISFLFDPFYRLVYNYNLTIVVTINVFLTRGVVSSHDSYVFTK